MPRFDVTVRTRLALIGISLACLIGGLHGSSHYSRSLAEDEYFGISETTEATAKQAERSLELIRLLASVGKIRREGTDPTSAAAVLEWECGNVKNELDNKFAQAKGPEPLAKLEVADKLVFAQLKGLEKLYCGTLAEKFIAAAREGGHAGGREASEKAAEEWRNAGKAWHTEEDRNLLLAASMLGAHNVTGQIINAFYLRAFELVLTGVFLGVLAATTLCGRNSLLKFYRSATASKPR